MKKIFLVTTLAALFMACSSPSASTEAGEASETVATSTEGSTYFEVDAAESSVAWKGTKPTGDSHTGTVAIKAGKLSIENGQIAAGKFILDLTQMTVTDEGMDDGSKAKLVGHLSNEDFFEVEKHPTASFEVTEATEKELTGNLTIKGVTKSVTVPYFAQVDGAKATARASFSVDRTEWGITFSSGNFFKDLGDHLIDDAIQFDVELVANAK